MLPRALTSLALAGAVAAQPLTPFNIEAFGAIAGVDTHAQAVTNGAAFASALIAANASTNASQRAVLVPGNSVYSYLPSQPAFDGVTDVTIFLEGTLNVSTDSFWTQYPGWPSPWSPLQLTNCARLSIVSNSGAGLLNGRGNEWWWYTIFIGDHRANLLEIDTCTDLRVAGITLLNSAQYHVNARAVVNASFTDVTVMVDIEDQLSVYRYMGGTNASDDVATVLRHAGVIGPTDAAMAQVMEPHYAALHTTNARRGAIPDNIRSASWFTRVFAEQVTPPVPMIWALNTDGIDVAGQSISVTGCNVTNFDDSVCVKPGMPCTSGIAIENIHITYGVGVSMGSVPPDVGGNCIDGVFARNVEFDYPLKGIYVKPNPMKVGQNATGTIANVVYEDIVMNSPLWWSIWVGTQQQQQPGSSGTGCSFIYPILNSTCPTDPQVTVANITLRRVDVYNALLSPGVLIANSSNPARGFVWEDVVFHNISAWPVATGYLTAFTYGIANGTTSPVPAGFVNATR